LKQNAVLTSLVSSVSNISMEEESEKVGVD